MKYISTRQSSASAAEPLPFDAVLLAGLARDGGLYMPQQWPRFAAEDIRALRGLSYAQVATRVMAPFVAGAIADDDLAAMAADTYAGFDHDAVAPLVQLDSNLWALELFHGPTLAFKDYALQFLGRAFDLVLGRSGRRITIVGATSGDTGSAAIEACRDRDAIEIFILHPAGRVSEVQRRQMTTVPSDNVHNIAVKGTFDDCQDLVKAMFNDQGFRDRHALSAVNSINWARIMAQIVYYFWAAVHLGAPDRQVTFAVPTGNFGNVLAGDCARRMGLPVRGFVVGSNSNDILTRFFQTGTMAAEGVSPTLSPSMDIQVSSNFERLLWELYDRDGAEVERLMARFRQGGSYAVEEARWRRVLETFAGHRFDDDQTTAEIARLYRRTGHLIDPHSAVGIAAAAAARAAGADPSDPVVALATAHPAKFPDAVEAATGIRPALPPRLADLFERAERCRTLPNNLAAVQAYIADRLAAKEAA
ncbi:MAG: threonine synthase [Hyphomicrobiales bacterium]|nr:threonine synthase [Hyphomicrobiales bacterium]